MNSRSKYSSPRALGAAIVAGGVIFSASLYSSPGKWVLSAPPQAEHGGLSGLHSLVEKMAARPIISLANEELPTLVHLTEILDRNFPAVRADVLLSAVRMYGLPQVVKSLDVVVASGLSLQSMSIFAGGGGGGGGQSAWVPTFTWADLALLLEMLMRHLPASWIPALPDMIAMLLPALVSPAQAQHVAQELAVAVPAALPIAIATYVNSVPPLPVTPPSPVIQSPLQPIVATTAPTPTPEVVITTPTEAVPAPSVEVPPPTTPPPVPTPEVDDVDTSVTIDPPSPTEAPGTPDPDDVDHSGSGGNPSEGSGGDDNSQDGGGDNGSSGGSSSGGSGSDGSGSGGSSSNSSGGDSGDSGGGPSGGE